MKIQDLRIGNLVYLDDKLHKVESLGYGGISINIIGDYVEMERVKGIPLADAWLHKMVTKNMNIYDVGIEVYIDYDGNPIVSLYDKSIENKIEYVHQIQNLFYSLTGKELEISL